LGGEAVTDRADVLFEPPPLLQHDRGRAVLGGGGSQIAWHGSGARWELQVGHAWLLRWWGVGDLYGMRILSRRPRPPRRRSGPPCARAARAAWGSLPIRLSALLRGARAVSQPGDTEEPSGAIQEPSVSQKVDLYT